ncbi:hypothetical protein YC2023_072495 [Brassica napus]
MSCLRRLQIYHSLEVITVDACYQGNKQWDTWRMQKARCSNGSWNPQIKYSTANLSILHLRQSFSQGDTITSLARRHENLSPGWTTTRATGI